MAAKEQKEADAKRTEERKAKAGKAPEKPKWAMTAEQVRRVHRRLHTHSTLPGVWCRVILGSGRDLRTYCTSCGSC